MARRRQTPALATVTTPNGARFTVAAEFAHRWQAFFNDPDWQKAGFKFDWEQSGGFADRNIRGTNKPSLHASGRAVDINWTSNPRGSPSPKNADPATVIDPALARRIAERHGMVWGGDWKNPDPMHFEIRRTDPVPMQERSLTAFAGVQPQQQVADGLAPGQAIVSPNEGLDQNTEAMPPVQNTALQSTASDPYSAPAAVSLPQPDTMPSPVMAEGGSFGGAPNLGAIFGVIGKAVSGAGPRMPAMEDAGLSFAKLDQAMGGRDNDAAFIVPPAPRRTPPGMLTFGDEERHRKRRRYA